MVSLDLWQGESLVLGILMIGLGLLQVLVSMPLAKGQVRAHQYNWRLILLYKLSDEEKGRASKPAGKGAIVIGVLYALSGVASIALGATGNGQYSLSLFIGATALMALALIVVMVVTFRRVKNARKESARQAG